MNKVNLSSLTYQYLNQDGDTDQLNIVPCRIEVQGDLLDVYATIDNKERVFTLYENKWTEEIAIENFGWENIEINDIKIVRVESKIIWEQGN